MEPLNVSGVAALALHESEKRRSERAERSTPAMAGVPSVGAVLRDVAQQGRQQLVQEQLVAMPSDERVSMLGSVFGLMTREQRVEILERLQRTARLTDGEA